MSIIHWMKYSEELGVSSSQMNHGKLFSQLFLSSKLVQNIECK